MDGVAQVQTVYMATVVLLIAVGLYCIISKRELLRIILGIEIMASAINLNFLVMGLGRCGIDALAQSMAVMSMAIGACLAAVALALIVNVFRHYGTTDVRKLRRLRW